MVVRRGMFHVASTNLLSIYHDKQLGVEFCRIACCFEGDSAIITNLSYSRYFAGTWLFVMMLVIPVFTSADCLKDRYGEIYCGAGRCLVDSSGVVLCSRYYDGYAERTSDGQVLCGKGQCVKRRDGLVYCSTEIGGAVLLDSSGSARCYGQCEPATAEMCENTRAGS